MCGSAQVLVNKKAEEGRRRRLGERDQGRERERESWLRGQSWRPGSVCTQKLQQMEIWGQEIFWGVKGDLISSSFPRDRCAIAGCGVVL